MTRRPIPRAHRHSSGAHGAGAVVILNQGEANRLQTSSAAAAISLSSTSRYRVIGRRPPPSRHMTTEISVGLHPRKERENILKGRARVAERRPLVIVRSAPTPGEPRHPGRPPTSRPLVSSSTTPRAPAWPQDPNQAPEGSATRLAARPARSLEDQGRPPPATPTASPTPQDVPRQRIRRPAADHDDVESLAPTDRGSVPPGMQTPHRSQ